MRDNLLSHNIQESDKEDCTDIIFKLLEEKLEMPDARRDIKIDRAHRVGRKRDDRRKPRAIVAKFNFFPDLEKIRYNAKKIEGNTDRNLRAVSRGDRERSTNIISGDEKSKGGSKSASGP
jgi:hypothetical protein